MRQVFEGQLILPERTQFGQLVVEDGIIAAVRTDRATFTSPDYQTTADHFISPGFIDIQINGGFGKEFKTDDDALSVVAKELVRFGTTGICPTITTTDLDRYQSLTQALLAKLTNRRCARVLGFHFEGPALNPKKVGAQNVSLLKTPADLMEDRYLGCELLKVVTLAPELEGAHELIAALRAANIRVGIGHSVVSFEQLTEMFDPSIMMIVHVFNAMEPLTSREPGVVGAALVHDDYVISIIPDGIHTHPATLQVLWNAKRNKRKIIAISDGSAVAGLDPGTYVIGSRTITRDADRAILPNGTLVGSVLTLDVAVRNLIAFTGCSICEAVNTVSLNPATYLGVQNQVGHLGIGTAADLVILDRKVTVVQTYVGGKLRYDRNDRDSTD